MDTQNFWVLAQAQPWEHSVKHMDSEDDTYWFERLVSAALCHSENFELSRHDSCWVVQKLEVGFRLFFLFFFILLFCLILQRRGENINIILTVISNPFIVQEGKGQPGSKSQTVVRNCSAEEQANTYLSAGTRNASMDQSVLIRQCLTLNYR